MPNDGISGLDICETYGFGFYYTCRLLDLTCMENSLSRRAPFLAPSINLLPDFTGNAADILLAGILKT